MRTVLAALILCLVPLWASAQVAVNVAYLERRVDAGPTLSNLDPVPEDQGLAGAMLGLDDNATTGRFMGHEYTLESFVADDDAGFAEATAAALGAADLVVVNAPAADLLAVADQAGPGVLIFNAGAPETALRSADCRGNVLHTLPSRAMLADALAQFSVKRKWTDWALIEGPRAADKAFAAALRESAAKFRINIEAEKAWTTDADLRRNASVEVPLFTQDMGGADLMVIADEANDFARYILFNTWEPVPVAGSDGMVPAAWHRAVEQHGAAQLQSRFHDRAGRDMRPIDYAAWAALRSIGEAVTRTGKGDAASLRGYILSEQFELAGFKGRKLGFRSWSGQLRQPIPLAHHSAVVALAPLEGFLHKRNEMDTLGLDKPNSACRAFEGD